MLRYFAVALLVASSQAAPAAPESRQYVGIHGQTTMMSGMTSTPGTGGSSTGYNVKGDLTVLNYALTLENLEAAFYVQALQNFTKQQFLDAGLTEMQYTIVTEVRDHEVTHVAFLSAAISALGATPVPACVYQFPVADVASMLTIARALEKTGVSAYIGAAPSISNPAYLTAAAQILTTEARHAAFFNLLNGGVPAAGAFDVSLDTREIISIAGQFIVSCPYTLPQPFPALAISPASGAAGSTLTLTYSPQSAEDQCVFIASGGNAIARITNGACTLPANLMGDIYVVIVNGITNAGDMNDGNTVAGPATYTVPDKADVMMAGSKGAQLVKAAALKARSSSMNQ